ncbi:DUF839 domain-containing protein [Roseofilum reptotaenium CS-1145]|uniref:Phosphatase n=1 Tax=Roseofilum reptotaenium AO1-A TaxID=1925591 RepID=A0A1L9QL15_9CYAN|nr:alkaline phosphatase PhoX [Roseofilum reptotaenium]MDB9519389.1 DUF839 domain-containing protein [Roseofilum reptotaenium CS-1145]OJJ18390.1 phosphatase [Roseofilum reptotaenium AO1-A]
MTFQRRQFLLFLGATATTVACGSLGQQGGSASVPGSSATAASSSKALGLTFDPVKYPCPLSYQGLSPEQQKSLYSTYEVLDDVVLPEGYTYDVIGAWGDKLGNSRFGYNNDYLSFVPTGPDTGFLTINFEYVSVPTWEQTYPMVMGKSLPSKVLPALDKAGSDGINAFELNDRALKAEFYDFFKETLIDQGIGVISLRREANGQWVRTYSPQDRRITGISGLEDGNYLRATGPSVSIFRKTNGIGYIDTLSDKIIGTFNNCAGGTSPWGTVFSAEENFQNFVPEGVYADGTSLHPKAKPVQRDEFEGQGNPFGLAGNKYGWMVEVDPANGNDYGTKHTWLGRFRHEAVGIRAEAGKPLVVYSGCDRRGGHVYKFVSKGLVRNPQDKANSRLLSDGMLYAAKFNGDGTGSWIPLKADTPVNPDLPSDYHGGMIPLPHRDRTQGGFEKIEQDGAIAVFKQKFRTLGDLYQGNTPEEVQGAILIDAHFAANAAGATCTARPEDTMIRPGDGALFIAFTSGSPGGDGGAHKAVFSNSKGESHEHGWIMRLEETSNDPAAMTFRWDNLAMGGEATEGGMGFSNPDNLDFDSMGNLWMVTDMSTSRHNKAVPSGRVDEQRNFISQSNLRGIFGNNSMWYLPLSGEHAGEAYPFALSPMETESCGPFFTEDRKTLFLAIQHPGERYGMRKNMASETREFSMMTTDGQEFMQKRVVPLGSNWPGKGPNDPPKPSVIVIRRIDNQPLV